MKTAKLFLIGMYIHLALSFVVPVIIVFSASPKGWGEAGIWAFIVYLLMILAVQITGSVSVGAAVIACRRGDAARLRKGLKTLKFFSIPFYIINFIHSFLVWFLLVGASRGLMALLLPIPIMITCLMVLQSGCVGCCYIKILRRQPENNGAPHGSHYLWQLIPVADVISTLILTRRYSVGVENI